LVRKKNLEFLASDEEGEGGSECNKRPEVWDQLCSGRQTPSHVRKEKDGVLKSRCTHRDSPSINQLLALKRRKKEGRRPNPSRPRTSKKNANAAKLKRA